MTIYKRSKTVRHGSFSAAALAIAFGTAFLLPTTSSGAEPQDSVVTSISAMHCSSTTMYAGVIEGIFISPITSVVINGVAINSSTWVQSRFEVTIAMPPSTKKTFTVSLLNGLDPVMVQETLYCEGAEVLPTETGGSIPSTGTNNYNNLLGGIALVMVGSIGVLFRKRIITN